MVIGVIKKFISRVAGDEEGRLGWDASSAMDYLNGVGLREFGQQVDYDEIVASLEVKKLEIERLTGMLVHEVKDSYARIVDAMKNNDRETAELIAAEVAMKNTLIKALAMVSRLLHLAISRIKTAKSADELAKILGPAVVMLRNLNDYMASVAPEVAAQLSAIKDEIERLYAIPGINLDYLKIKGVTDLVPESKEILRKAYEEASKDVERLLPPPPEEASGVRIVDLEELQEQLLEYIKRNEGRINITKAARELGVTPELIRKALFRLEEKGVIRLTRVQTSSSYA